MYLLGCKCFSVVTDHANLVYLLKQSSDKLTYMQTHWEEKLMRYAKLMRILYMKEILNEAGPVSRRPDFLPIDNLYKPGESPSWDEKVADINSNCNGPALLALSTLEALNVGDDFLSNLKGAYSTCAYFSNDNNKRRLRQKIEKSSDGLFRYHNRVVIPRQASALIKALLFEYHDNVGHPNYRRLMASLLKLYWWDKMTLDCKLSCQHCVICNKSKHDRRGGASLHLLGIPEYP
jgi:hypothetical protein